MSAANDRHDHHDDGSGAPRTEAQERIDEAFHRDKLGLPLSDDQRRIVQFLSNGFGCTSCAGTGHDH